MVGSTRIRRHDGRLAGQLRPVQIHPGFVGSADGSCLIEVGKTRVICTASLSRDVPEWMAQADPPRGWVTAEYGMLPASTGRRKARPVGKPDSRGVEIQRLIGRVLRSVVRMDRLGPCTVHLDCDVLEADGGTRTASITGAWVALALACRKGHQQGRCGKGAVAGPVAAVSTGMLDGQAILDLDYREDSAAEVDMNIAMTAGGQFVEIQGTAEGKAFNDAQLGQMLLLARRGIKKLIRLQREAVAKG